MTRAEAKAQWYRDNRDRIAKKRAAQYRADPERHKALSREWARANPDKRRAIHKRYRAAHPQQGREQKWKGAGIDLALARELYAAHDGRCGICCTTKPGGGKGWHMDHDHKTGRPRGLLCCGCNLRLGWFEKYSDQIGMYLGK